jgi:precorrin-2 methylase
MLNFVFQTIAGINSQIATQKGNRVKLQLSKDGIRVVKSTMIQGKMLHDFIPLENIQFMTVSQNLPDLLMVISLTTGDNSAKFQVNVNSSYKLCKIYKGK